MNSRSRLTSIGLSVLINLALIGLMARVLVSAPAQGQRYIAVELRTTATSNVQRSTLNVQRQKQAVPRSSFKVQGSAFRVQRPQSAIDPRPLTIGHSPLPLEVAGSLQSFTSGGEGTSATGPGASVGSGPGSGTSGSGEGTVSVPQSAPTPNTPHPTPSEPITYNPQPITPTPPKGESRAPSVAKQIKPVYPPDAREDGVEGVTVVLALIDPEGKVAEVKLEKGSGDRRLDRAALDAVRQWTYNPCLRDGVPVKSSVRVRVEFRLE